MKRQAQGLERNLKAIFHLLEDKYMEFQQLCRVFNPKRGYTPTAIKDIRETYKMVTAKVAEARGLLQLMRGKYRGYVQVDPQLQRQIEDLALMYRKDYRFFEQNQSAIEREQMLRQEKTLPAKLLTHLYKVYRATPSLPSLLLCFQGDQSTLERLAGKITLGDKDLCEKTEDEMWVFFGGVTSPDGVTLQGYLNKTLLEGLEGRIKGVAVKLSGEVHEETIILMRHTLAAQSYGEIKLL